MQIGVVFPQNDIGADVGAIRAYAAAISEAGYRHVLASVNTMGAGFTSVDRHTAALASVAELILT